MESRINWLMVAMNSERVKKNSKPFFIAHLDEIKKLVANGINAKQIWRVFHENGIFPGSYPTFWRLIKKYIPKMNAIEATKEILKNKN